MLRWSFLRWWLPPFLLSIVALIWLYQVRLQPLSSIPAPQSVSTLLPGTIARMDSPAFTYSPGWQVHENGADPHEPTDPWTTPSGVITFTYQGQQLALQLAVGNYWGYFYATVDGEPANLLPSLARNPDSRRHPAGYKTFYEPEQQTPAGLSTRWLRVHTASDATVSHTVRIELWRSWGQIPLRAVAIDALPTDALPLWPAVALLSVAFWWIGWLVSRRLSEPGQPSGKEQHLPGWNRWNPIREGAVPSRMVAAITQYWQHLAPVCALFGCLTIATAIALTNWLLCLAGLALLALAGPIYWLAALLFALPFYYSFPLPLLPGRSLALLEIGLWGGIALALLSLRFQKSSLHSALRTPHSVLWLLISWALIATFAAEHWGVALREWRTVFLAAGLLQLALTLVSQSTRRESIVLLWLWSWLAGAALVAVVALLGWLVGWEQVITNAEGVTRLRGFYGSPNNLALYLGRPLAVSLALALFVASPRLRWGAIAVTVPIGLAFLLTYSKGAIAFAFPVIIVTLALGGTILLRRQARSLRPLGWLAAVVVITILLLLPTLGTTRLRGLVDPSSETSVLRINLWRSSWQMALDHSALGVGPDNFLYAYRSDYMLPVAWREPDLNHPHNWLLDWWTRLGLPGLLLGLTWWGLLIAGLVRDMLRTETWHSETQDLRSALTVGILAATLAALAHGLIDISYALSDLMLVWVWLHFLHTTLRFQSNGKNDPQITQITQMKS